MDEDEIMAWMADSVAVRHGRPLTVYHGTNRRFTAFDPSWWGSGALDNEHPDEAGFFFTPARRFAAWYAHGPEGRIVTAHLRIRNPYRVTGVQWGSGEGLSPREAMEAGHDSYIVSPYEPSSMWIVFDPGNILAVAEEPRRRPATALILKQAA